MHMVQAKATLDTTRAGTPNATLGCMHTAWGPGSTEATQTHSQNEALQHTKPSAAWAL